MHPAHHIAEQHRCPLWGRQVCRVRLGGFTVPTSTSFPVESRSSEAGTKHLLFLLCRPLCAASVPSAPTLLPLCLSFSFLCLLLSSPPSTGLFQDHYLGCELGHRLQAPQSRLNQRGWRAALEVGSRDAVHLPRPQDRRPTRSTAVSTWPRLLRAKCICGRLLTLSEPAAHKPSPPMQSGGCSGGCSSL